MKCHELSNFRMKQISFSKTYSFPPRLIARSQAQSHPMVFFDTRNKKSLPVRQMLRTGRLFKNPYSVKDTKITAYLSRLLS